MLFLRGHHLICLHFFNGEGYNREFIENLSQVLRRAVDETVEVTPGADDVCAACPSMKESLCQYREGAEEEIGHLDETALALLGLLPGEHVLWKDLEERIPLVFSQWYGRICRECGWLGACSHNKLFIRQRESHITKKP